MKSLMNIMKFKTSLKESLLDDIDVVSDKLDVKPLIKEWLKENLKTGVSSIKISNETNKDGKYEVSSKKTIVYRRLAHLTSLTNGLFIWNTVDMHFDCSGCPNLASLEGAPKEVGGCFYCSYCDNLHTLEGAPKEVGGYFDCSHCNSLKTLEGAPKKVGAIFNCSNCASLTSLKDVPKNTEIRK